MTYNRPLTEVPGWHTYTAFGRVEKETEGAGKGQNRKPLYCQIQGIT